MNAKQSKIRLGRARRRKSERGVSPIIATILLVAITVVLAAVLYVLVSGLTRTGASTPYELGMQPGQAGTGGSGTTWTDVISLSPTSGLTTSAFGMKVITPSATTYPTVGAAGCTPITSGTVAPSSCTGVAGDWYAALTSPSTGYIVALYSGAGGGSWSYASGSTVALTNGYQLWIITGAQVTGNSYTLSAYSTGTSSVSGSTLL